MNKKYTIEQIKYILDKELFIKKYNIDYNKHQPANCSIINKLRVYFKDKYPGLFSGRSEILYCYKNRNNKENLISKMFCICGNKNNFLDFYRGYSKHCSYKCSNSDKNKILIAEQSYYKHFGVRHNWASKDPKLNGSATRERKYGVKSCLSSKDPELNGRATIKRKYGETSIWKTEKYKNLWKDKNWKNKRENNRMKTLEEKYHGKTPLVDSVIQRRRINTMRKNGTFNSSKIERDLYLILKQIYKNVFYIHKDKNRYPFNCDFYIQDKDLFIELNIHWTHGGAPFDENNQEHLKQLEKWRQKSIKSNFYKTAIDVWTKRDPLKLKTFIDNKLNYKIFYNKKEIIKWLKTLQLSFKFNI